jgi:hypothetical protein
MGAIDKVTGKRQPPAKGGSRKGIPNRVTKELKDMILQALDGAGGVEYLRERAEDPKTASAFLSLVGKTLPLTVKGPGLDGSHTTKVFVEFVGKSS